MMVGIRLPLFLGPGNFSRAFAVELPIFGERSIFGCFGNDLMSLGYVLQKPSLPETSNQKTVYGSVFLVGFGAEMNVGEMRSV